MFRFSRKPFVIALTGVSLCSIAAYCAGPTDMITRAAAQFRHKSYSDSYTLAKKSSQSPQRSFLLGVSAFRSARFEESIPLLADAEQQLPLLGDYAALYQSEALLKLGKYVEASGKAASIYKAYPSTNLVRKADKIYVDAFIAAGDYRGALKACQKFIEKYPSGSDSVDVLFQSGRSLEETGDKTGAVHVYRSIWLNNPISALAQKSLERLKEMEKTGVKVDAFSADELLQRATTLYSLNEFNQSLHTLQSIRLEGQPASIVARVDLRTGMALYRLRNWKSAEKSLARAAAGNLPAICSEARFWQARAMDRQELDDQAFSIYMGLAGEGKKQVFGDDALLEAASLRKSDGRYGEAALLYEQLQTKFPESKYVSRSMWESAWCRYLAGEYALALETFRKLSNDDSQREKALYWLARSLENLRNAESESVFKKVLDEYPAGFYASWIRENKGVKDLRESLKRRDVTIDAALPAVFEKPRLLASLGMQEEARSEIAACRRKASDKKALFPGLAKLYLESGDYGSAINLFLQNRPVKWDNASLPLWTAGYPLPYNRLVLQYTGANNISEGLTYALMRAESSFNPVVKSPVGAVGLMQLMPATARETAREKGKFNAVRLTDPEFNIKLGTRHFRDLLKRYDGDVIYSLAAYNAGASALGRWRKNMKGLKKDEFIENIPYQETRDYVKKIYASAAIYRQLYGIK